MNSKVLKRTLLIATLGLVAVVCTCTFGIVQRIRSSPKWTVVKEAWALQPQVSTKPELPVTLPAEDRVANSIVSGTWVISDDSRIYRPESWLTDQIRFRATAIDNAEVEEYLTSVCHQQLNVYTEAFRAKYITHLYLLETLSFSGLEAIGTQDGVGSIWVASQASACRWAPEQLIRTAFHHEVACLLYVRLGDSFPKEEWEKCLPEDFQFSSNTNERLREQSPSPLTDVRLFERGFVSQYATVSLKKDFACLSEAMILNPLATERAGKKYSRLGRKIELWKSIMQSQGALAN